MCSVGPYSDPVSHRHVVEWECKRHAKHQLRLLLYDMFARVVCVVCAGWWSDVCVLECSRKKEIFFLETVQF